MYAFSRPLQGHYAGSLWIPWFSEPELELQLKKSSYRGFIYLLAHISFHHYITMTVLIYSAVGWSGCRLMLPVYGLRYAWKLMVASWRCFISHIRCALVQVQRLVITLSLLISILDHFFRLTFNLSSILFCFFYLFFINLFSVISRVLKTLHGSSDDIGWMQRAPEMAPVVDGSARFRELLQDIR